jgi:hypothetical protein
MKRSLLMRFAPILLAASAMMGCTDLTSMSRNGPTGDYTAIILMSTENSVATNVLVGGGSFTLNLAANGTTSGHLHILASGSNPALDADMAGTWTRNGNQVEFTQAADTFVRDMTFTIEQITDGVWFLVGDQTFGTARINVRLAQNS